MKKKDKDKMIVDEILKQNESSNIFKQVIWKKKQWNHQWIHKKTESEIDDDDFELKMESAMKMIKKTKSRYDWRGNFEIKWNNL